MNNDRRHHLTSFHLTVRMCVVSRRIRAFWRSLTKGIKVVIRLRIGRVVFFVVRICSRND